MISDAARLAAGDAIETREVDQLVLAGHTHSETVFEIMAVAGGLKPQQSALRERYTEGLAAYRARHWDDARFPCCARGRPRR